MKKEESKQKKRKKRKMTGDREFFFFLVYFYSKKNRNIFIGHLRYLTQYYVNVKRDLDNIRVSLMENEKMEKSVENYKEKVR